MSDLMKWEFKNLIRSKAFWGMGIAFVASTVLFLMIPLCEGGHTGYQLYLENLNNFNSLMLFLAGIFAGIHITGAFEDRKIQSAVMAGNTRFGILITKAVSFLVAMASFFISSVGISTLVAFASVGVGEVEGSFFVSVIVRGFVMLLADISFVSICLVISMLIKNQGASITVNLLSLILLYCGCEALFGFEWCAKLLRYTPVGQILYLFSDVSGGNLMTACAVSVVGIAAAVGVSYIKFSKEELK